MLFTAGPLSIYTLVTDAKLPLNNLYYAVLTAAVPALLILGGQGRSLLGKLPSHSDLKTPVEITWWILGVLALLTGAVALNQDSKGRNGIAARIVACLSLIGMAAMPPIVVAATS